jgi:hypothetical protein
MEELGKAIHVNDTVDYIFKYLDSFQPGSVPEIFFPNVISTGDLHSSVYFSPNGQEVYFSRLSSDGVHSGILYRNLEDGEWMKAIDMGNTINTKDCKVSRL